MGKIYDVIGIAVVTVIFVSIVISVIKSFPKERALKSIDKFCHEVLATYKNTMKDAAI